MGNNNGKNTSGQYNNRPHSVLGVRGDERYTLTDPDVLSRYYHSPSLHPHPHHLSPHSHHSNQDKLANKISGKAILPPLPRSHSFHQILRPTENGVNLIQKGTIRGIDHHRHHNSGKELLLTPPDDILNPELNAILRERRCKSEADLLGDGDIDDTTAQEDKSTSDKSTERSIEGLRKGLGNGVAARIQRAKYKAPAPPVPVNRMTNDAPNGNNNNEYNPIRSNGDLKMSSSSMMFIYSDSNNRDSKRSLQAKEKSTPSADSNKSKLGLIRRLSDKSYFPIGRSSSAKNCPELNNSSTHKDNFVLLPRLKGSPSPNFDSNHGKRDDRYTNYDEMNCHIYPESNEPSLNEINDFIAKELALRSSVNDSPNGMSDKDQGASDANENGRRGVSKMFKRDKMNDKNNRLISGSNEQLIKNTKPTQLPPVFDDNFILKRTTPNAGLNQDSRGYNGPNGISNKKALDLYPSKINNYEFDRNKYNQEGQMSPKLGISNMMSNKTRAHQNLNGPINHNIQSNHHSYHLDGLIGPDRLLNCSSPSSPDYQRSSNHNQRQSSANHRSQWILGNYPRETTPISLSSSPSVPPPPPPTLPFISGDCSNLSSNRKEESITRLDSLKHLNHSSISDSANYSDEDDEEEIKVVLKPYLPPPRRLPFNEEPIIIVDDLFNSDDNNVNKCPPLSSNRQQCWTPMEDLTSSEEEDLDEDDDDGIHCDPQSEDEDGLNKRDVRELINDYNTRFTLKNQLRTIIQNNKLRSSQGYP
ncbi:putative uncharacterized protein DDB_G0282133 [Panonychus citri]|uniref:putative uncharacterized protein DDB_G0282133 n=1 Tax=Panonychus citri TaxID=50023 RepID=UPI0023080FE1|nr:putative uncharacterized protein DDB_G0282133 [Panonychus citri]XP_053213011.1 putative uncharacterized protein DDB_G0282133 [Panonychus citri]